MDGGSEGRVTVCEKLGTETAGPTGCPHGPLAQARPGKAWALGHPQVRGQGRRPSMLSTGIHAGLHYACSEP